MKLAVRAGDAGRLFGSVTPSDVVAAIKAVDGPLVDKRRVEIGSPIKSTGAHQVTVKLHSDVVAQPRRDRRPGLTEATPGRPPALPPRGPDPGRDPALGRVRHGDARYQGVHG